MKPSDHHLERGHESTPARSTTDGRPRPRTAILVVATLAILLPAQEPTSPRPSDPAAVANEIRRLAGGLRRPETGRTAERTILSLVASTPSTTTVEAVVELVQSTPLLPGPTRNALVRELSTQPFDANLARTLDRWLDDDALAEAALFSLARCAASDAAAAEIVLLRLERPGRAATSTLLAALPGALAIMPPGGADRSAALARLDALAGGDDASLASAARRVQAALFPEATLARALKAVPAAPDAAVALLTTLTAVRTPETEGVRRRAAAALLALARTGHHEPVAALALDAVLSTATPDERSSKLRLMIELLGGESSALAAAALEKLAAAKDAGIDELLLQRGLDWTGALPPLLCHLYARRGTAGAAGLLARVAASADDAIAGPALEAAAKLGALQITPLIEKRLATASNDAAKAAAAGAALYLAHTLASELWPADLGSSRNAARTSASDIAKLIGLGLPRATDARALRLGLEAARWLGANGADRHRANGEDGRRVSALDCASVLRALDASPLGSTPLADRTKVSLAEGLARDDRALAERTLESVFERGADRGTRGAALRALRALGSDIPGRIAARGVILHWHVLGPFEGDARPKIGTHPFGDAFADPEAAVPAGVQSLAWQEILTDDADGQVDLKALFGKDNVVMYATTRLDVPAKGSYRLKLGSDDGVAVWVDGKRIHLNDVARGVTPDDDDVAVELDAGRHRLLVQVVQGAGGAGFCVRTTDASGAPLRLAER